MSSDTTTTADLFTGKGHSSAGDATVQLPIEEAAMQALYAARDRHLLSTLQDNGHPDTEHEPETVGPATTSESSRHALFTPIPVSIPEDLHHSLGDAFRHGARGEVHGEQDSYDIEMAVNEAVARCTTEDRSPVETIRRVGEAFSTMSRLAPPLDAGPVDWSEFGALIPVISGSPGSGASVVAAALTDALQREGRCALLVDAADPARSGLADAGAEVGLSAVTSHPDLAINYSWRADAVVAQLGSRLATVTPGMMPPPRVWLPEIKPLHATVVDIGHDGWRSVANPLLGVGGWLRAGYPSPRPVVVVRPTRPSLAHAEHLLARLESWVEARVAAAPVALVVVGVRRWPVGVVESVGELLADLVDDAVFLPHDPHVHEHGVTSELLPERLTRAVLPLLDEWALLPRTHRSARGLQAWRGHQRNR